MLALERARYLSGPGTISSVTNSIEENRALWDRFDWTARGEEWTRRAASLKGLEPDAWKATIAELIQREVPPRSVVLEVGPGAGRWTEMLRSRASHLVLVDISATCLDLCRDRFGVGADIEYHLHDGQSPLDVRAETVDVIWSYDVFVHINPNDVDAYLAEFARILKPGGRGVVHHSGGYDSLHFRAPMSREWFAALVRRNGLDVESQDAELAHEPGDIVTFIRKPGV
jgi:ubiquinone/menaquinone biosynthesis C-methylase UbiE